MKTRKMKVTKDERKLIEELREARAGFGYTEADHLEATVVTYVVADLRALRGGATDVTSRSQLLVSQDWMRGPVHEAFWKATVYEHVKGTADKVWDNLSAHIGKHGLPTTAEEIVGVVGGARVEVPPGTSDEVVDAMAEAEVARRKGGLQ